MAKAVSLFLGLLKWFRVESVEKGLTSLDGVNIAKSGLEIVKRTSINNTQADMCAYTANIYNI